MDAPRTERTQYPSMLEVEARLLGLPAWDAAKTRIRDWGKRVGAKVVHVVDPKTMMRLESIAIE